MAGCCSLAMLVVLGMSAMVTTAMPRSAASSCGPERTLYVDANADYKKNHIDDELNDSFQYYIGHAASMARVNHHEERHGAKVSGHYGLVQPDGVVRSVRYEVDGNKGYRSVVHTRTAHSRQHHVFDVGQQQQQQQQQLQRPRYAWHASKPVRHAEPVAYII